LSDLHLQKRVWIRASFTFDGKEYEIETRRAKWKYRLLELYVSDE
jgi:hypothetical protein